jgi:hypothetical protein
MRHLADDIMLSVKDAVRNLRYVIRSEADRPLAAAGAGMDAPRRRAAMPSGRRRGHMAGLIDTVLSEVESGALALVSPRQPGDGAVMVRPVGCYFGDDDDAAARLFVRAHYHTAKALLARQGARNVLIFEHMIAPAREEARSRHAELVGAVRDGDASPAERIRLCAAIACRLASARPIRESDFRRADGARRHALAGRANDYCFAAIGLATAIASVREAAELPAPSEIVGSAAAVAEVRLDRFAAALDAADPVEALARQFEEVLPVLP